MLLIQTITKATVTETTQETHKTTCEREREEKEGVGEKNNTMQCAVRYRQYAITLP